MMSSEWRLSEYYSYNMKLVTLLGKMRAYLEDEMNMWSEIITNKITY
jgi:hypothetical protein